MKIWTCFTQKVRMLVNSGRCPIVERLLKYKSWMVGRIMRHLNLCFQITEQLRTGHGIPVKGPSSGHFQVLENLQ